MRCPSCGAVVKKRSMRCPECGAFRNKSWVDKSAQTVTLPPVTEIEAGADETNEVVTNSSPSLIEFPGVNRTSIPEWRKELGERVREVQERRAREALPESGIPDLPTIEDSEFKSTPLLELIPPAEPRDVNPIVAAALQRIERAHAQSQFAVNAAVATLIDYDEQPAVDSPPEPSVETDLLTSPGQETKVNDSPPERIHNLAVVPSLPVVEPKTQRKPKRLIGDENDPALNYLDTIQTPRGFDIRKHAAAPISLRFLTGVVDLVVISLLASPLLAVINAMEMRLEQPRVIAFIAASVFVIGFLYLTAMTALSGRTFGMRLCSLRVVDERTGLIPTGTQSAGRAFVFMLSMAVAAIPLAFTFIDREKRTSSDRFTRTAVVRV